MALTGFQYWKKYVVKPEYDALPEDQKINTLAGFQTYMQSKNWLGLAADVKEEYTALALAEQDQDGLIVEKKAR